MNWYEKHLGDWAKKTTHLSMLEEGCYSRLLDWCYAHERALPAQPLEVNKIARARTPAERQAVRDVLRQFWTLLDDGWHQTHVDEVLAAYAADAPNRTTRKALAANRQRASRERRHALMRALSAAGVFFDPQGRSRDLWALAREHGVNLPVTHGVTRDATSDASSTSRDNQSPYPTNQSVTTSHGERVTAPEVEPSKAGAACRAMRVSGVQDVNPSHPELLRLLAGGVSTDELKMAAAEASAKRKGFAYALAVVAGRRKDAAQKGPLKAVNGPTGAARDVALAWAPMLAARDPGPAGDIEALP